MKYGFVKTAAATPFISVAAPSENSKEIIKLIEEASENNVEVLVFPELCVTGYTCGELFLSEVLMHSVNESLVDICRATLGKQALTFVGSPIYACGKLYSCAVVFQDGQVLGVVPKMYLPSYSEFYELRYFTPGKNVSAVIEICGQLTPFGTNVIFAARNNSSLKVAVEICEDMFVIFPPSNFHAQAGASIIVNLSASNELIGKSDYRKVLIKSQSGRLFTGYIYASAGSGESVSDMIFSGHRIIAENGKILKESRLFETGLTICEIDLGRIMYERRRLNVFQFTPSTKYRTIEFNFADEGVDIVRYISPWPFIPEDSRSMSDLAEFILQLQSRALAERLKFTGLNAVIGISGGLDSCLAFLAVVRAYKILGKNKKSIVAVTMPGPGTSIQTVQNVLSLENMIGIHIRKIPILSSVEKHLEDINHMDRMDTVYENAQARERMQILMDIANAENGLVIGTSDLSESALGWCTYNGDHISMYAVNSSIPKTLVKYLVSYEAKRVEEYKETLYAILNTEISPELLPLTDGKIAQKTENIIGPYELHDFFLYYTVRFGQSPDKTLMLACKAFRGKYDVEEVEKYLKIFIKRFFANQFKRNCVPDGIKVGTISLSPRGDWRMATESSAKEWEAMLNN
jgi:NAD+ synthase (glutamine-hydrolysing)